MAPKGSERKSYGQFCPLAGALDVVGDRWTMLVVRELLGGPARFNELLEGLPGIAKNLLTTRLRRLEEDGIVRRANTSGAVLYSLTEQGAAIRTALEQLAFWGARVQRLAPPEHPRSVRAIAMAMHAVFTRASGRLPNEPTVVELEVDDEFIEVRLGPRPSAIARPSTEADARIRVSSEALSDYLGGRFDKRRFVLVSGDAEARSTLLEAMA